MVVSERPHADAADIAVVHEVVLVAQRGGVVVVELSPGVVVAAAGIVGGRAVPAGPGGGGRVVPVVLQIEGALQVGSSAGVGIRRGAAAADRGVEAGAGRVELVAVVGHTQDHLAQAAGLGDVLVNRLGVVVRVVARQGGVGQGGGQALG